MLFIMFDIEIIFVYPYAVNRDGLGYYGFWAILAFSVIFFLTFVYEVARGGLDWGPIQKYRSLEADAAMVSPERTAASTIRRVGAEGRLPDERRLWRRSRVTSAYQTQGLTQTLASSRTS